MIKPVLIFIVLSFINIVSCQANKMEGFVVGGEFSRIKDFPHSVCLGIEVDGESWKCGSSILNQRILITAAHCVHSYPTYSILIQYGSALIPKTMKMSTKAYRVHPGYSEGDVYADIAMILTPEPLQFNLNVRRVAVLPLRSAPYDEVGSIAGWGYVDEINEVSTERLKHIEQRIMSRLECTHALQLKLPAGVICGAGYNLNSYASSGDSGSALVVRTYIQVGLVSYKEPSVSRSIVIYTDIGYYYNWIRETAIRLVCSDDVGN